MMMLADAAQENGGKLYVIGGGWNVLHGPSPTAVVLLIHVPWDRANLTHEWLLELLDHDHEPIVVPGPAGEQDVLIGGNFEVGRPPGVPYGSELPVSLAVSIAPLPLAPGRYVWRLKIDGETDENWRLPFSILATPRQQARDEDDDSA